MWPSFVATVRSRAVEDEPGLGPVEAYLAIGNATSFGL